jgi:hypothetical protein
MVREASPPVDVDPRRPLPPLRQHTHSLRLERISMSYDTGVKRWVASKYQLSLDQIAEVSFDVQYAGECATLDPTLQLEIDVHMHDGTQHLFTRSVRDFGQIINEVVEAAS